MNWVSVIIIIIIFVAPVVQKMIKAYADWQAQRKQSDPRGDESLDRRQMDMRQEQNPQSQATYGNQPSPQDLAEMTMADRIELARRRASQQVSTGGENVNVSARAGGEAQQRAQAEALRRQEEQINRHRQQQEAAREQARRRQSQEAARRQQAQASQQTSQQQPRPARAARQAPSRQQQSPTTGLSKPMTRRQQRVKGDRRAAPATDDLSDTRDLIKPVQKSSAQSKPRGRDILQDVSLKKAFILKEILDPSLALRTGSSEWGG